jgi:hypothetical protein
VAAAARADVGVRLWRGEISGPVLFAPWELLDAATGLALRDPEQFCRAHRTQIRRW